MNAPSQPRRFRWLKRLLFGVACLATLLVLFHVEENWRGERAWAAYREQLLAKGAKLDFAAFIPPRVPDEQNFAMTPFLAPLSDLDPSTGKPRETEALKRTQDFFKSLPAGQFSPWRSGQCVDLVAWRDALQKPPAADQPSVKSQPRTAQERAAAAPALLAALKPYEPVIEELRAASRRPHSRFNLNYETENPVAILLPHFLPMRQMWRVLMLRASAELASGQTAQAFDDLDMILRTLGTKNDFKNVFLVGHLVSAAGLDMAVQIIWEGLASRQWSDSHLQSLQARLQGLDFLADLRRTLEAERAAFGNTLFDYLGRQPHTRLLVTLQMANDSSLPGPGSLASILFGAVVPCGWLRFEQLNYNRAFEEQILPVCDVAARRVYPKLAHQNEKAFEEEAARPVSAMWNHRMLSRLLLPALSRIFNRSALAETTVEETLIACALERCRLADGKLPDALDALAPRFIAKLPHDVITGQPLKYRHDGGGYTLYSVGWNENDDGGKSHTEHKKLGGHDIAQGDWVWHMPAR